MNQTRTFLLIAWLSVATLLFMEWSRAPQGEATLPPESAEPAVPTVAPAQVPAADLPPLTTGDTATALSPAAAPMSIAPVETASSQVFELANDVLRLRIDSRGGKIIGAELLQYPVTKTAGSPNVHLFDDSARGFFQADFGLLGSKGEALSANAAFTREAGDARSLTLQWADAVTGLTVRKHFQLSPGSYVLDTRQEVGNQGSATQLAYQYELLDRVEPPPPPKHSGLTDPESYSFVGAAWFSPQDKFEKRKFAKFADEGPLNKDVTGGWIAMLQHHFLAAWVPSKSAVRRYQLNQIVAPGQAPVYNLRAITAIQAQPGSTTVSEAKLWIGPKLQAKLDDLAPTLKLSVDYGILTFIAQPVFDYVLRPLHALTGNWGWAIILTVVILKLLLYPLSAAQYRSAAKMRAVQPRLEALKERYGDDKQKYQMAMMELFKKEKINPAGGCLPVLLTIPVFISLYWVLLESVELRQAPWMGWIDNLTAADPYFVLPAINLLVMWLTQKMTPAPGMDPMQKKMMQFMPLVFGVMFAFFPAGLVLYWCTNGLLGLAQQWFVTRQHDDKTVAAR